MSVVRSAARAAGGEDKMKCRFASWPFRLALVILFVSLLRIDVAAVRLGGAQITLQSMYYYKMWDLTWFVYRVTLPSNPSGLESAYWVLGPGGCVTEDVLHFLTSEFDWVDDPFHGMRFELTKQYEMFSIWLKGQWDVAPTPAAAHLGEAGEEPSVGTIDGPACEEAAISVDVLSESQVVFPVLSGPGVFEYNGATELRISSTSQGWSLGHSLELAIPEEASYETVERIFHVLFEPYETLAGTVQIGVTYELIVSEEDFAGLPEGTYTITVTFRATTD